MGYTDNYYKSCFFLSDVHFSDYDEINRIFFRKDLIKTNPFVAIHSFWNTELEKMIQYGEKIDVSFITKYEDINFLCKLLKKIEEAAKLFWEHDLKISYYFVDRFPEPFNNRNWKAMSISKEQSLTYSLNEGIYFKKNEIIPYLFEIIACHEINHQFLSIIDRSNSDSFCASLFEEGICDFFSYYILASNNIVPMNAIERFVTIDRALSSGISDIRYSYWVASNRIEYLYSRSTKENFFNYNISHRSPILKKNSIDIFIDNISYDSTLMQLHNLYRKVCTCVSVSVEEYIVLNFLSDKISIERLKKMLGWHSDLFNRAIKSLLNKSIIHVYEDVIYNPNFNLNDYFYYTFLL